MKQGRTVVISLLEESKPQNGAFFIRNLFCGFRVFFGAWVNINIL